MIKLTEDFIWRMEEILDLYDGPYDKNYPLICFDERPYQLLSDVYPRITVMPGQVEKYDYEYKRNGTCNIFVFYEPHTGWRHVKVTEQRRAIDVAECMREIVDKFFPKARKVRIVKDNLNVHSPGSLYKAFPPEEARRILKKLEYHYTPKHASWLNMVEIEIGILARQCLDRRIPYMEELKREILTWEKERNKRRAKINWCFKNEDARKKLEKYYPSFSL